MKERTDELDFIKMNFCSAKDSIKRMRRQPQTERKYLQKAYLIKDCYPNYMMNSIKRNEKMLKIIWYFLLFSRQVVSDSL